MRVCYRTLPVDGNAVGCWNHRRTEFCRGWNGGQSLNLHQFARDGVVLLGQVRDAHEGQLIIAPDLKETLAAVDQFEIDALKKIDD